MPAHQARPVVTETDLELPGGRTLHVYDTAGDGGEDRLTVFWHHGTPNLGPPPEPLFPSADRLGIRWVSYDRPGYGGSTPRPGRDLVVAGGVAERALTGGLGGMVDDDLAYVAPWGFDPAEVRVPVLVVHGGQDRVGPSSHGRWLAGRIPSAELVPP